VLVIIGLFLIKTFFGAVVEYLEETEKFRISVKPKNKQMKNRISYFVNL